MTIALVRRTSSRLAEGLLTHLERQPIDIDLAKRQWEEYVDALEGVGWQVIEVPPLEACADSVFIEDTVVMFRDVAVITRPGNDARKPEVEAVEPVVASLGCRVERIMAPGTLDGGDVLKVNDTVYVGLGGRTNQEGIAQLAKFLEPLGATVVTVPVTKVLHLKSAVTALPDGTIIGWDPAVDDPAVFPQYLSMPEESGAHVVIIDDKRLLMAADAPKSASLLESLGYGTIRVDISEYIKLEGCVTCLSVRMRDI
ncbi:MAG: dimethylargininase [Ilumatobacteraceae bacterium]